MKPFHENEKTVRKLGAESMILPREDGDIDCRGCKYDIPGDCLAREFVDGWYRFPEGNCWEPKEREAQSE